MSTTVSLKVKKEIIELVDKMIRYGLAKNRNQAFNLLIELGKERIQNEIEFWDKTYSKAEELARKGFRVKHGGLNKILEEDRR